MYQAMILPVFKGVCYFLPTKCSLEPAYICTCLQDQYHDLVVEVFRDLHAPSCRHSRVPSASLVGSVEGVS